MTLTPTQVKLLARLSKRNIALSSPTHNELAQFRSLVKQGFVKDTRTNIHIWDITPSGSAALESHNQVEAQTKHTQISTQKPSKRDPPAKKDNIMYRFKAVRDWDKQS